MFEEQYKIIKVYKDMTDALDTLLSCKEACDMAINAMQAFSYKKQSFGTDINKFMKLIENRNVLSSTINEIMTGLNEITKTTLLDESRDIRQEVFVMNKIKGMTLEDIAEKLGYSYGYIRKISSQIKNYKIKNNKIKKEEFL